MSLLIDGSVHMITASLGSPALVEELQRIGRRTASESVGRSVGRAGAGARARAGAAPASLRPAQWRGADDAVDGGWGASSPEAHAAAAEGRGRHGLCRGQGGWKHALSLGRRRCWSQSHNGHNERFTSLTLESSFLTALSFIGVHRQKLYDIQQFQH